MQTTQRQTWLDWLRIASIIGVLFFHSCMPFATDEVWHLRNKETSDIMLEFVFFMHLVRMPLLFFISGTVSYYMMRNRSAGSFIGLRVRRLLLPLAFGIFVVVPPQIYLERVSQGYTGGFGEFYLTIFKFQPYPHGNFSWHHLWFIAYLFLYDLLLAPLFTWLMKPNNSFVRRISVLAKNKGVYLLTLPSIAWYTLMAHDHPQTNDLVHDACYFVYYMLFLLVGFICIAQPALMDSLQRNRRFSFAIAILSLIVVNYFRWTGLQPWDYSAAWRPTPQAYLLLALRSVLTFSWVFTALGYGKQYLNRTSKALPYLNQAVYPFYILHQTIIVILAAYVLPMHESIMMKYWFIVAVTFFASVSIFHVFIRPYAAMRLLFGMKPDAPASKRKTVETAPGQQPQPIAVAPVLVNS